MPSVNVVKLWPNEAVMRRRAWRLVKKVPIWFIVCARYFVFVGDNFDCFVCRDNHSKYSPFLLWCSVSLLENNLKTWQKDEIVRRQWAVQHPEMRVRQVSRFVFKDRFHLLTLTFLSTIPYLRFKSLIGTGYPWKHCSKATPGAKHFYELDYIFAARCNGAWILRFLWDLLFQWIF